MYKIVSLGLLMASFAFAFNVQPSTTDSCSYESVNGHIVLVCPGAYPPPPPTTPKNCYYATVCESIGHNCHNELICSGGD